MNRRLKTQMKARIKVAFTKSCLEKLSPCFLSVSRAVKELCRSCVRLGR